MEGGPVLPAWEEQLEGRVMRIPVMKFTLMVLLDESRSVTRSSLQNCATLNLK